MTMNERTLVLVLLLKLASCNIFDVDVIGVPARVHKDAIRHIAGRQGLTDSSGRVMVLPARVRKDAILRIINSFQQSRQPTNEIERFILHTNGRHGLAGNGGRVMIVPARVDRLHVKPDFSQGLTLVAREPGSNPAEVSTDTARFFFAKDVELPFITPLIQSQPVNFLTPPPVITSAPINTNNLQSSVESTNSFIDVNNEFVPNSKPTTSPDPIFYYINNPTPFSTQVSSSHPNSNLFESHVNTNNRGVLTPHPSISPNQLFYFVNRPTPPANNPSQTLITPIGNDQIDITHLRNNIVNMLSKNKIPNQQFDPSQPESNLEVQSSQSNALQQPDKSPTEGVANHPILTPTEINNSPLVNTFPNQPFDNSNNQQESNAGIQVSTSNNSPLVNTFPNQPFDNSNTQQESNAGIQVSTSNNLNSPQESTNLGVDIQQPLTSTVLNDSPHIINPNLQQLNPPSLDLPKPEPQVQQAECLLCNLLSTSNPSPSSTNPNDSQQKPEPAQSTSLQPKELEALMIIVDGVLFRADPPDIGIHSSVFEDPKLMSMLQRPKESIVIVHENTSQIKPSILSMLGSDVNMNFVL